MTLEELQAKVLEMEEKQKTIDDENKNLKTQLEEKVKREKQLEEHNQKLFLRITTNVDDKTNTKEDDEIKDHIGDEVYKLLNHKDKEKLNTILKGEDE